MKLILIPELTVMTVGVWQTANVFVPHIIMNFELE